MPNAPLIQRSKTGHGMTRTVARTTVLGTAADRRQHSAAEHAVMRNKANPITALSTDGL